MFSTIIDKILCFLDPHKMKMSHYFSVCGLIPNFRCFFDWKASLRQKLQIKNCQGKVYFFTNYGIIVKQGLCYVICYDLEAPTINEQTIQSEENLSFL